MKVCKNCNQNVKPVKVYRPFSWKIFIIGLLMVGVGAAVYLGYRSLYWVYYKLVNKEKCPICGGKI